ncbi:S-methyl thiohydantoin desulfurase domain-containing protein [Litchfieldia alkalitelluris]|uniref:S-methyl thiohydantoin desulfurase domain-containing protein n=1 Tax=Litchfieldia alkalitelluris TaxID=304268 RepID=UPI001F480C89|nr:DUF917 family protein [Litchfieldia alkalitelluris]
MFILDKLTEELIEPLVIGGCILGGGGGGSMPKGKRFAELAFEMGTPSFIQLDQLNSLEETVVTVSGVGAPAAKNQYVKPQDYLIAFELLENALGKKPTAIITNENGGFASVNGLLQSALTGIPILDAACNGRAHPTGIMGSMGLTELENYQSIQVGVGGKPGTDARVELVVKGSLQGSSKMIRQGAVQAGGLVTVARNPVKAEYIKNNGAIHAISHAVEVGMANVNGKTPEEKIENVVSVLGGKVINEGQVRDFELKTIDGFDLGKFTLKSVSGDYALTFWNEYMSVDLDGTRLTTFPDLIMTFSAETGLPITSAELADGVKIVVITAPYQNLRLGSGMFSAKNYEIIEKVLDIEIIPYITSLVGLDKTAIGSYK